MRRMGDDAIRDGSTAESRVSFPRLPHGPDAILVEAGGGGELLLRADAGRDPYSLCEAAAQATAFADDGSGPVRGGRLAGMDRVRWHRSPETGTGTILRVAPVAGFAGLRRFRVELDDRRGRCCEAEITIAADPG